MTLEGAALPELLKLFAIFGGAMALLYVLRLRRRRVQVPFSPLWSRVVVERQASSLFRTLKRIGSLLVQLAIIALVVLALGDPKVSSFAGCTHEEPEPPPPRHTLVIIDASASMATVEDGRTRLSAAREEAHRLVTRLAGHPSQRVMIVQLDAMTRPLTLWTSEQQVLHRAIDAVAADGARDTPTAIDDALRLADDALRGRDGGEVILISDLAFDPIAEERVAALNLSAIPVGRVTDNIGIEAFNVRPYPDDSVTYVAWYAVRNETERVVSATLFVYANPDGRSEDDFFDAAHLIHSEPLELAPSSTVSDRIAELKFSGSRVAARLVVDSDDPLRDAFDRDDVAFAVVPERRTLKVQLVTEGNLFLDAALALRENVALTTRRPSDYSGPEGFDVTVVDRAAVDLSKPGNYFVINPPASETFDIKGAVEQPEVARVDTDHPLARFVSFADINVLETPVYATTKTDEVVVSAKGGAPLLFTRVIRASGDSDVDRTRRFVVLSFDLRQSLLPMNYAFPLLVVNAVSWFWEDAEGLLKPNRAGVPLAVRVPGQSPVLEAVGPNGAHAKGRRVGDKVHLSVSRLGIWALEDPTAPASETTSETDAEALFAVNLLSANESRIAPGADYPSWVAPAIQEVHEDPWLRDFWRVLLLAALGVVLIEWLTWHRRVTL